VATKKTTKRPIAEVLRENGDLLTPPAGTSYTTTKEGAGEESTANGPAPSNPPRVLHVNGKPIPVHFQHAITYEMTDEGIAELNARRVEPSGVQLGDGPWEKNLQRRMDLANDDNQVSREVWDGTDPAVEAVKEFGKPGFAHRLLSPQRIKSKGYRNWKPVVAPNGDPVTVGTMILGAMPESKKRVRQQHYANLAREAVEEAEAQIQDAQDRIIHAAGDDVGGTRSLRHGERLSDSRNPQAGGVSIGYQRSRGTRAA